MERAELARAREEHNAVHTSLTAQLAQAQAEKRGLEALAQQTEQRWTHWFREHFAVQLKAAVEAKEALQQRMVEEERKCEATREELLSAMGELAHLRTERGVLAERSEQQAARAEAEQAEHSGHIESLRAELQALRAQATADAASVVRLERELGKSSAVVAKESQMALENLSESQAECAALRERVAELSKSHADLTAELSGLRAKCAAAEDMASRTDAWHKGQGELRGMREGLVGYGEGYLGMRKGIRGMQGGLRGMREGIRGIREGIRTRPNSTQHKPNRRRAGGR